MVGVKEFYLSLANEGYFDFQNTESLKESYTSQISYFDYIFSLG